MEIDINPYRALNAEIDAVEFEKFCLETLTAYAKSEGLSNFTINHNQKIEAHDSTYQIDIWAEYTALGCKNKVIVECKKHSRSIERSVVTDLYAKTQSIGAQKSILISTSGFQADAVKYAEAHGIALWQMCDVRIKHITASANRAVPLHVLMQIATEEYLPDYFMLQWDCAADWPYEEIFPTLEMRKDAVKKAALSRGITFPPMAEGGQHI